MTQEEVVAQLLARIEQLEKEMIVVSVFATKAQERASWLNNRVNYLEREAFGMTYTGLENDR